MKTLDRLRWRIANLVDRLPGQCWSDLADYPLGTRRIPWAPQRPGCQQDADRLGGCYCGKLRNPDALLPVHLGNEVCPTCGVIPGERHTLSCPEVSGDQFHAFLTSQRYVRAQQERRDRLRRRFARVLLGAAVLVAAALVWGWAL